MLLIQVIITGCYSFTVHYRPSLQGAPPSLFITGHHYRVPLLHCSLQVIITGCPSFSLFITGHHYRVPLIHLCLIIWPTARIHDGSTSGVQGTGHVGVTSLVDLLACMATVQLQHIYAPIRKCLEGYACDWKYTSKPLANLNGNFGPHTSITDLCVGLYVSLSARVATTGKGPHVCQPK